MFTSSKTDLTTITILRNSSVFFWGKSSSELNLNFLYFCLKLLELLVIDLIRPLILLHSSLQGQCLKCSVGCNVDDQTEGEINAPNCHKVSIPHFIRIMILIKPIFYVFFILIWRTVALYIQFDGNKAKKMHEWIEFLTRVKLSKFVGKFLVFFRLYDGTQVIYVERSENNTCFYIFSRDSVLKISSTVNLITKQTAGLELSYKSSLTKMKSNFRSTALRRIFDVFKLFGFAKIKILFALYKVRNYNSNPKRQKLKMGSCV